MEPVLKDLQQAAEAIPCTQRWLADGLRSGRFPGHKIGRRWMLSEGDIAAILEICSVTPGAFSTDTALGAAPSSSMTRTTLRRLRQSSHPP
jgi:hypothetical protein